MSVECGSCSPSSLRKKNKNKIRLCFIISQFSVAAESCFRKVEGVFAGMQQSTVTLAVPGQTERQLNLTVCKQDAGRKQRQPRSYYSSCFLIVLFFLFCFSQNNELVDKWIRDQGKVTFFFFLFFFQSFVKAPVRYPCETLL